MRIFLLTFLIIQYSFAQPPKITNLIQCSKSQKEFEKFMILNDGILNNINNTRKFFSYEFLEYDSITMVNEIVFVGSDERPSKNPKYDRKYTSNSYPFYEKVFTESYLNKIIPVDSFWHIINQPGVKKVGFYDENVSYEPTLVEESCNSNVNNTKEYAWHFNNDKSGAEIFFTHNLKTVRDCSTEEKLLYYEKTLTIRSRVDIFNKYTKEIMSICEFNESTEINGNLSQKFTYSDKTSNLKCIINCSRIEEEDSGEIVIYWKMKN